MLIAHDDMGPKAAAFEAGPQGAAIRAGTQGYARQTGRSDRRLARDLDPAIGIVVGACISLVLWATIVIGILFW